jgi:hypothetical protein
LKKLTYGLTGKIAYVLPITDEALGLVLSERKGIRSPFIRFTVKTKSTMALADTRA